ncbi:MAG TPA: beta-propeller fold lactonase family protein [Minicystis sp.]|nr:beta-propeller fold lactonase family protein [Minicystis sp.]
MNRLTIAGPSGPGSLLGWVVGASALALAVGAAAGCGDNGGNTGGSGGATSSASSSSSSTSTNSGGSGGSSSSTNSGGSGGGGGGVCTATAAGPTRGAAVALTPDDKRLVAVNRDAGTVTVMSVDYAGSAPTLTKVKEIPVGGEPWQVAIDACGTRAYVVLRKDQKVVTIDDLDTSPKLGASASVGSEPTSLALTPNNKKLYVANWVDGTLTILDGATLAKKGTVDLNAALVAAPAGYVGQVAPRPSLAHPRSIAITNNGDASDDDEKVYVTEYFGQRVRPESTNGTIDANVDTTHEGVLYSVKVSDGTATTISLAPLADTGFKDHANAATGCYPNQLQGVAINGHFAYVTAICASPKGPLGIFQKQACVTNADCANNSCNTAVGACNGGCNPAVGGDADCAANLDGATGVCVASGIPTSGACKPITTDVKTTTHPVMLVVDTSNDTEVGANASTNLNKAMWSLYDSRSFANDATRRLPLVANEVVFVPNSQVGYLTANGADAVFRFTTDPSSGAIASVGGDAGKEFINLAPASFDPDNTASKGIGPIGLAMAAGASHKFLFTDNDITRNVSTVDLAGQVVAGGTTPSVAQSSDLPTDAAGLSRVAGKKFFNTGLGRWSLRGQGWGACQSCHTDGLTDNVTWYFARGPRQSVSLDATFSKDGSEQRILNWTAIVDEIADFENNTRGVSGGVGALVATNSSPPALTDRINLNDATSFPPAGATNLAGSAEDIDHNLSVVKDNWTNITDWVKTVRSPRAPTNLDAGAVSAGKSLFDDGNCKGCHGGKKWTISTLFYSPTNGGSAATNPNAKLLTTSWDAAATAANFPAALFPAANQANRVMRFQNGKPAAFDQIQCILRPVGTFATSPAAVGVIELRQDMATPGQGNQTDGNGFNPPSLLNLQAGAPYFHAGNARTLEEAFSATFAAHYDAIKTDQNFLTGNDDVKNLVAFLLSIDGQKATEDAPALGPLGGDFCATQ